MARKPRIGINVIYDLQQGREQVKSLATALARDFSVGGGGGISKVSVVGGAINASIKNDTLFLQAADKTPKDSADFELTPLAVTLNAYQPETITASYEGNGIVDYWRNGEGTEITKLNATQFKVVGKKRGNYKVGFWLSETEPYYGASQNIDFTVASDPPPLVLMNFDDSEQPFLNTGSVALTERGTINATLEPAQFSTGAYCSLRSAGNVQAGFYGLELGEDDFTVEFFLSNKYNKSANSYFYIDVAPPRTGSSWTVATYPTTDAGVKKQEIDIYRYDDTGDDYYIQSADIWQELQNNFRHFAFVYQHDLRIGRVFVNGVKVLERENLTLLSQQCLLYWQLTCIDALRISPYAVYTENFTPPQEPY